MTGTQPSEQAGKKVPLGQDLDQGRVRCTFVSDLHGGAQAERQDGEVEQ